MDMLAMCMVDLSGKVSYDPLTIYFARNHRRKASFRTAYPPYDASLYSREGVRMSKSQRSLHFNMNRQCRNVAIRLEVCCLILVC